MGSEAGRWRKPVVGRTGRSTGWWKKIGGRRTLDLQQRRQVSRSGEMADATDSKSVARKGVWVQVPPPVL